MQVAKQMRRNPREIATALIDQLPDSPWVERVEIAGAGFINVFLRPHAKREVVRRVLADGRRLRPRQARQGPQGAGRVRVRQSDRAAARGARPRRRLRREPRERARRRRIRRGARVLRQRCRPPDGHPVAVGVGALSRTVRRGGAVSAQRLPGRVRAHARGGTQGDRRRALPASGATQCSRACPPRPKATRTPSKCAWTR